MNGQERSQHVLASSSSLTSNASGPPLNNGAPSGTVNSNSWLRDMVADPIRAAQAGILNPRQDNLSFDVPRTASANHPPTQFPVGLTFQTQMMQMFGNRNGSALNPMMPPMQNDHLRSIPSSDSSGLDQAQRLLMPTSVSDTSGTVFNQPYKNHPRDMPAPNSDTPAKRMKLSASMPSGRMTPTATKQSASQSTLAESAIPHRPEYFHKGSVIQLGKDKLKMIEDLQTSDFESSAELSADLSLDCSTVVKISQEPSRGTAFLTFSVGDLSKHKPMEATVEATLEHPFFVYGQGWSSVSPERTYSYYKMNCHQLNVHDKCISLTLKNSSAVTPATSSVTVTTASNANSNVKSSVVHPTMKK